MEPRESRVSEGGTFENPIDADPRRIYAALVVQILFGIMS